MDIIEYINNPVRIAVTIDQAIMLLDHGVVAEYDTLTPTRNAKTLKERFGVDSVLVDDTLVLNVTKEMVDLVENDTLLDEIDRIGLDRKKFRI